jgi:peroxiredoxin
VVVSGAMAGNPTSNKKKPKAQQALSDSRAEAVPVTSRSVDNATSTSHQPPASSYGLFAQLAFVALSAVLMYSFVSVAKESEMRRRCAPLCLLKPEYAGADRSVPEFVLKDTKGRDVSSASFKGKVVILNFWTKTCAPCMEEMPDLYELGKIVRNQPGVELVTISADETAEDAERTLRAMFREDPPFTVLMDPDMNVIRGKFGTTLYPETWIIDAKGVIRARFDGKRQWTSGLVNQLIEQVRVGGFCPLDVKHGEGAGSAKRVCDSIAGGT